MVTFYALLKKIRLSSDRLYGALSNVGRASFSFFYFVNGQLKLASYTGVI